MRLGLTWTIVILTVILLIVIDQIIHYQRRKKAMIKNNTWKVKHEKGFKNWFNYFKGQVKALTWVKVKKFFLGRNFTDGLLFKVLIYTLLVSIGYVYVYPILYMISTSLKSRDDIINPMVMWIPTKLYLDNYVRAYNVLKYFPTLLRSMTITLLPALISTIISSIIGYGFAKFNFKGKKFWLVLIVLTFLIPTTVYIIPKYVMFFKMGLLNKVWAIILPALFGQGLNSAIFILIFFQFFRMIPHQIDEAAMIDGAGPYKRFVLIGIPLSIPAFVTSFLFGFVWYWNETYSLSLFLSDTAKNLSLQIRLAYFVSEYNSMYASEEAILINEGIRLGATLLIILPMLILYFILQRSFVEGVERSGITGE